MSVIPDKIIMRETNLFPEHRTNFITTIELINDGHAIRVEVSINSIVLLETTAYIDRARFSLDNLKQIEDED